MHRFSSRHRIVAGFAAVLLALGCGGDNGTGPGPVENLISCVPNTGGDFLTRGMYIDSFPGVTLNTVRLYFSATAAENYTISLTARNATYDGTIIASDTIVVALSATTSDTTPGTFDLGAAAVSKGSTVTFLLSQISGSGSTFFHATSDATCPITETTGTTPPLDTFRNIGRGIILRGSRS
jgi:hypothetical protein